jgi:hypothetical protein
VSRVRAIIQVSYRQERLGGYGAFVWLTLVGKQEGICLFMCTLEAMAITNQTKSALNRMPP